ncbi:MAG: rhodanese-like domain-containing protein [Flavobacterium sp.]|uniref:rhodanese-like domain-containing protein n=1 Tax=Flavobacterium sp. TaxID=239 RepID=UPI003262FA62
MGFFNKIFGGSSNENTATLIKEDAFLVDVRSPSEFAGGHVKGSVNISLGQVQNSLSKFKGKDQIVVFCRSGNRSGHAKSILEQNGFTNVTNGGTWQKVNAMITKK